MRCIRRLGPRHTTHHCRPVVILSPTMSGRVSGQLECRGGWAGRQADRHDDSRRTSKSSDVNTHKRCHIKQRGNDYERYTCSLLFCTHLLNRFWCGHVLVTYSTRQKSENRPGEKRSQGRPPVIDGHGMGRRLKAMEKDGKNGLLDVRIGWTWTNGLLLQRFEL